MNVSLCSTASHSTTTGSNSTIGEPPNIKIKEEENTEIVHPPKPTPTWKQQSSTRKNLSSIDEIEVEFGKMIVNVQEALKKTNIDVSKVLIKLKSSSVDIGNCLTMIC